MTSSLRVPPIGGDHWNMNASRDLERRVAQIMRDRGLKPATDEQMAQADADARREWNEHKARIMLGRLDARYRDARPRHQISHNWLADFRLGDRYGLVILGEPGVGKTWEACAIARSLLLDDSVPVSIVHAGNLMEALKPNRDGASDLGQFQVAPVLVLDDLGAERSTEWSLSQLHLLAEYRNVRRLPTILTTNLSGAELRERYSNRTIDRFVEGSKLLTIVGKSHRVTPI